MLNTLGDLEEFKFLMQADLNKSLPKLTQLKLKSLTETKILSTIEKIEVLELFLGFRFLTECYSIKYNPKTRKDGFKHPIKKDIKDIESFFNSKLQLKTNISKRKSKKFSKYIHVVYISPNEAINKYFIRFEKRISSLEIGILYGYHPKAVLAFSGYINSVPSKKPIYAYQYYNSKIYPKDFYDEVDQYHKAKWDKLKKIAPEIISEAEKEFQNLVLHPDLQDRAED